MLNMYKQVTIHTLKKQGEKNTTIARQLGCYRNTVRNILLIVLKTETEIIYKFCFKE